MFFLLLSTLVITVLACRNGYTTSGDGFCYKMFNTPKTFPDANQACANLGGALVSITNAFDNNLLTGIVSSDAYIGMQCSSDEASSCRWDDYSINVYNNFKTNGGSGNCVYIDSKGDWYRTDCSQQLPFVCSLLDSNASPCFGYRDEPTTNECYKSYLNAMNQTDAEALCVSECGHLVSIHDANENGIAYYQFCHDCPDEVSEVYIGLKNIGSIIAPQYTWSDGTRYAGGYQNFDGQNPTPSAGNCVTMSIKGSNPSTWKSSSCSTPLPFVCKRRMGRCTRN